MRQADTACATRAIWCAQPWLMYRSTISDTDGQKVKEVLERTRLAVMKTATQVFLSVLRAARRAEFGFQPLSRPPPGTPAPEHPCAKRAGFTAKTGRGPTQGRVAARICMMRRDVGQSVSSRAPLCSVRATFVSLVCDAANGTGDSGGSEDRSGDKAMQRENHRREKTHHLGE
jgi:hypothetical protein